MLRPLNICTASNSFWPYMGWSVFLTLLFLVPTGNCGREYVKLVTEWLTNFNAGNTFHGIAMKVVMTLPNILLQKPSAKSKAKDHMKALQQRLLLWNEGKLSEIWKECLIIQKKINSKPNRSSEDVSRIFSKLMFEGKVGAAMKYLEEHADNSVLAPSEEVVEKLQALHPAAENINPNTLIQGPIQPVNTAFFLSIDEHEVLKAAKAANRTSGSAGPSMFDAQQWKRILVSKKYKSEGKDLRDAIAKLARKIGTEILDPHTLETCVAGHLIALNKAPGEKELQKYALSELGKFYDGSWEKPFLGVSVKKFKSQVDTPSLHRSEGWCGSSHSRDEENLRGRQHRCSHLSGRRKRIQSPQPQSSPTQYPIPVPPICNCLDKHLQTSCEAIPIRGRGNTIGGGDNTGGHNCNGFLRNRD